MNSNMSSVNKPIQLGLCCINTSLKNQKPPIYASRRMIIKSIEEKGIDELKSKIIQNLRDVLTIMDWNEANGIKIYRMSSEMFPHKSNDKVQDYDFNFAKDLLIEIGEKSRLYNQRLTFHPGQYNVVGSPSLKCFQQTIRDLSYHADVMDLMGLGQNSVMVVHGGGIYGNKEETMERWFNQYYLLPENVRRRLVLENCEKCYSIEDCLEISEKVNIPVVFDTHHFECYKQLHPNEHFEPASFYMERILETWRRREIKPKFHISEQGNGRCGHHSDYIETIPEYLLEIPEKYGIHIDIMIEAKMKEQAILRLYSKYKFLNCLVEKEEQNDNEIKNNENNYKNDKKNKKKNKHKKYKLILIE